MEATEHPIEDIAYSIVRRRLAVQPAVKAMVSKDVNTFFAMVTLPSTVQWQAEETVQRHLPRVSPRAIVQRGTREVQEGHAGV